MNNADLLNIPAGDLRAMYANAMDQLEAVKRLLDEEPKPVTITTGGRAYGKTTKLLHELLRDNLAHQVRLDEIRRTLGVSDAKPKIASPERATSTGVKFNGFQVMSNPMLPPMTMMVGNDVFKMLTDHVPSRMPNE
ncbi:hypothetical protein [Halopseudomonas sp.]|uniref:hypothetical protein n=1 Tax=Halopseudomonas sp. TaxID=2901191 RepID=UPI003003407A